MSGALRRNKSISSIEPAPEQPASLETRRDLHGIVHVLTCGSVDDGKSTLIGRLLWEQSSLPTDQREMVRRAARAAGTPDRLDYSLLLDGLVAEREQGITIDIAWRFLEADQRRIVIIDSPGHEQYTRNMASGASHADVAVMLIDARHGIKTQTRRHAAILSLMGVPRVILAVNKMDLIDWDEAQFRAIERDFMQAIADLRFASAAAIPVSARNGDNIAALSAAMPWYAGQTLIAALQDVPSRQTDRSRPFRMPVQTVLRDGQDFRALAGTVTAGVVRAGDVVRDAASGREARVVRIATMDGDLAEASAGKAIALQLDRDLDIARGAIIGAPQDTPANVTSLDARLVWLGDQPLDTDHGLLFRSATDLVSVAGIEVKARLELETLSFKPDTMCRANDVVEAAISLSRPVALDAFQSQRETGAFLLIDPITGNTLAGGVVTSAGTQEARRSPGHFVLTRDALASGLCAGLGNDEASTREFQRRAEAALSLLRSAGVRAELEETMAINAG